MAPNPFWTWSLRLYKRPGVATACIALQDRAGIDVNLLLFCLWTGSRRVVLGNATMKAALRDASRWSGSVVGPLRNVRRTLKAAAQSSRTLQGFRGRVAALELEAERLHQDTLFTLVRDRGSVNGEPVLLAAANLAACCRHAGIRLTPRDWAALKAIVRAAF